MAAQLPINKEHGLLAPGIHDADIEMVETCYGSFQGSDRRCKLFETLKRFIGDVQCAIPGAVVYIDGSFVMACVDKPSDVDIVLVLPPSYDLEADVTPAEYNLISAKSAKRTYRFDVRSALSGSEAETQWLEYFQQTNPKWDHELSRQLPRKKGIVRLVS
ncbi:MAG: hypothetical protein R3C45_12060 [Phycisphaerales bacterium]